MSARVTVVDYGLGNLHSVITALQHLGAQVDVATDGSTIAQAACLVLPGVGAFADGMTGLRERGQVEPLQAYARSGRPLAGICLGAQLLLSHSSEFGHHEGLGIIPGRVEAIPHHHAKSPHVGWSRLSPAEGRDWVHTPLRTTAEQTWMYFVHSFHMVPDHAGDLLAWCAHGSNRITAAVARGAITGFQFHPEKSGKAGLAVLAAFLEQHAQDGQQERCQV